MNLPLAAAGLTAAAALGGGLAAGRAGALGAAAGGAIAALAQLGAARLLAGEPDRGSARFVRRWAWGSALRLAGVGAVAVAVTAGGGAFAPLPTGLGFLGVLLPLMALELRRER